MRMDGSFCSLLVQKSGLEKCGIRRNTNLQQLVSFFFLSFSLLLSLSFFLFLPFFRKRVDDAEESYSFVTSSSPRLSIHEKMGLLNTIFFFFFSHSNRQVFFFSHLEKQERRNETESVEKIHLDLESFFFSFSPSFLLFFLVTGNSNQKVSYQSFPSFPVTSFEQLLRGSNFFFFSLLLLLSSRLRSSSLTGNNGLNGE